MESKAEFFFEAHMDGTLPVVSSSYKARPGVGKEKGPHGLQTDKCSPKTIGENVSSRGGRMNLEPPFLRIGLRIRHSQPVA